MFVPRAAGALFAAILTAVVPLRAQGTSAPAIPLPEHPRPDLGARAVAESQWPVGVRVRCGQRRASGRVGLAARCRRRTQILVPFSWGSELSGVADSADIGWYARSVTIPAEWRGSPRLSRRGSVRLAHERLAGRREGRRASGRLHPLLGRAHVERTLRISAASRHARGRQSAPVQARGKAGLRQGARDVADGLPRGERRRPDRGGALHARPRALERRRRCAARRARAARSHAAARDHEPREHARRDAPDSPRRIGVALRRRAARCATLVAGGSIPARGVGERFG